MTNYNDFLKKKERGDDMVAVFHHEGTEKEAFEVPFKPLVLLGHSVVSRGGGGGGLNLVPL